mmetsp:Transcript_8267/g.21155  ORF Transcript_8267/g.21155 Transcript_8267/m.21155 type:complete len:132 (-) Transcript_8267:147-542(-)
MATPYLRQKPELGKMEDTYYFMGDQESGMSAGVNYSVDYNYDWMPTPAGSLKSAQYGDATAFSGGTAFINLFGNQVPLAELFTSTDGALNPCADMNFVDATVCQDQTGDPYGREDEVSNLAADLLVPYRRR